MTDQLPNDQADFFGQVRQLFGHAPGDMLPRRDRLEDTETDQLQNDAPDHGAPDDGSQPMIMMPLDDLQPMGMRQRITQQKQKKIPLGIGGSIMYWNFFFGF